MRFILKTIKNIQNKNKLNSRYIMLYILFNTILIQVHFSFMDIKLYQKTSNVRCLSCSCNSSYKNIKDTHGKKISWCSLSLISRKKVRPQKRRGQTQEGSLPLLMCISIHLYIRVWKSQKEMFCWKEPNGLEWILIHILQYLYTDALGSHWSHSHKSVGQNSNPKL